MIASRSSTTVITTAMMIERVAGLIVVESVDEPEVVVGTEEAPA